jgi:uncharacterized protein involved in exopolysaccharide biosynthesis
MTTSVRNPRPDAKPETRVRKAPTQFEAHWREPERTLVDYLAALWSRKLWIGLSVAAAGLAAVAYGLTQPNVYVSHAKLLVLGTRTGANAAEVAANMLRMGNVGPSQVLTALEVVNSSVVADRVVERLTPAVITQPYQPERAAEEEREKMGVVDQLTDWMHRIQASWFRDTQTAASLKPEVAAEVFRHSFAAWPDERASLIKMTYRAGSRTQAQRALEEVVQVVVDRYREVCAPKESREWVVEREAAAEKEHAEAKAEYDEFIGLHGRVRFAEDVTALERARGLTEATLVARKQARETAVQNLKNYRARLDELPEQRTRLREVTSESAMARGDLYNEFVRVENLIIEAEGSTSVDALKAQPRYQSLKKQLANIQARLEQLDQPRKVPVVDDDPEYLLVEGKIRELTARQAELDVEIPQLERELERENAELNQLYALQREADRLVERYTRAKTEYESLRAAKESHEFAEQLETRGLTSLQRVEDL